MRHLNEEMHRRWKEHRAKSSGSLPSLVIKIALLILVIWIIVNLRPGKGKFKNLFPNDQTTQPIKGAK
jgi:hypothetical protein